ncbi:MAG: site-specific integrase [Pseudonocardia sp.]|nr:MAG: site-specific integrase [Pseudonocardia sp.]
MTSMTSLTSTIAHLAPAETRDCAAAVTDRLDPAWRPDEWDPALRLFRGSIDNPATAVSPCLVAACPRHVDSANPRRCKQCLAERNRRGRPIDFDDTHVPKLLEHRRAPDGGPGVFNLATLEHTTADEIIFGLQQRDNAGIGLIPSSVKRIVSSIPPGCESLLDIPPDIHAGLPQPAKSLLRALVSHAKRAYLDHTHDDPTIPDVWESALIGLQAAPNRHYASIDGTIDFRTITQKWLREIAKEYGRAVRPPTSVLHRTVNAAAIASNALSQRPNGDQPQRLSMGDMSAIVAQITMMTNQTGSRLSLSHRRAVLGWWRRLIDFARQAGLMDEVPGTFALDPRHHRIDLVATAEDEIGRAIPEHVIAQMDAHLPMLGTYTAYDSGGWRPADFATMYQAVYAILRDTGRRPNEVTSLHRACLRSVDGRPTLIYDNHKRRRLGRRLPIGEATAAIIRTWQQHRDSLPAIPGCEEWLFPTPGSRNRPRRGHLQSAHFTNRAFRSWIEQMPRLDDDHLDTIGQMAEFEKSRITPYGLRHAYAQRHADAGTPVDVLRELMDHRSVDTTMGYYKIGLNRKRAAAELISRLAVNRDGAPAGFSSVLAYERESVAVPFGNCTEPSNVTAGGGHCPIRFQCAGCGFYRPDPSYIPAIEQHISQLRTDRETAIAADAATWVVDNLNSQIDAFSATVTTMKQLLDAMPDDQRVPVEAAARELRKARQSAAFIPLSSLSGKGGTQ